MTDHFSPSLKRYLLNAKKNNKVVISVIEADTTYRNARKVQCYLNVPEILNAPSEEMALEFMRGYFLSAGGVLSPDKVLADFKKAVDKEIINLEGMAERMAEYYDGLEERKAFTRELNRRVNNKPKVDL